MEFKIKIKISEPEQLNAVIAILEKIEREHNYPCTLLEIEIA